VQKWCQKPSLRNKDNRILTSWNEPEQPDVFTYEETWIFLTQYRNKELIDALQDSHFTKKGKSKKEQVISKAKDNLSFFDIRDIFMTEQVPEGQTVNQRYYFDVLTKL
jgi:hypothetical protein